MHPKLSVAVEGASQLSASTRRYLLLAALVCLLPSTPAMAQSRVHELSPHPGATPTTFATASDEEIAQALAPICQTIGRLLTQANGRLISCGRAERRVVNGRTFALTRYVRSAPSGFVSAWLVQYPDQNVVYSLTLNAPQPDEATSEPVFQQIWESLQFGPL